MANSCRIFNTEYQHQYVKKKLQPARLFRHTDCFADRIEESWQIDPHFASIPTKFDQAAEELVQKMISDRARSVYQVTFKDPRIEDADEADQTDQKEGKKLERKKIKDFQSELFSYIQRLYFNPHEEKILAPPVTAKRLFGYSRPKLLHGGLSMYQETYGRTGGSIMLRNAAFASKRQELDMQRKKELDAVDPCRTLKQPNTTTES